MTPNRTLVATLSSYDIDRIHKISDVWREAGIRVVLFVCTANYQRSKTCEDLFKEFTHGVSIKSAGVSRKECSRRGTTLCTESMIAGADIVYVFEPLHSQRINEHTSSRYKKKLTNLDIPDKYSYMSPDLIELVLSNTQLIPK